MKVSLITVCYNAETYIESAIQSVLSQTYHDIEYIIIDGGSTDGTLALIDDHKDKISVIVSEPDKGIYDAMNKGIQRASGEVVGILNADDVYNGEDIITKVVKQFQQQTADCVYGDLYYVDQQDVSKKVRYWKSGVQKSFLNGWHPPHPAFFVKNAVYQRYGLYNADFRIAADFEMMLRLIQKHRCKTVYLEEVLVRMRIGGESNKSFQNMLKGFKEIKTAFRINGLKRPLLYPLYRYLPKLKEFIR